MTWPGVRDSDRMSVIDRRPTGAGRAALRAFRDLPVAARVHATVRWWSAPLPRVEAALPPAGRVLEIGCGHGLFSAYAALAGCWATDRAGRVAAGKELQSRAEKHYSVKNTVGALMEKAEECLQAKCKTCP